MADTSSLKNRILAFAFNSSPHIITTFIGPPIARAFYDYSTWRWAFGSSAVSLVVLSLPVLYVLTSNMRKARAAGYLPQEKAEPWTTEKLRRVLDTSDGWL